MAFPTKYEPAYDFIGYQVSNSSRPLPADKLEAELNAIAGSIGESVDFVKTAIRSDGRLQNGIVDTDALDPALALVARGLDVAAVAADRAQADLDAAATAADRAQTELDAAATAADRVQTGLDAAATAADAAATAADAVATAGDAVATAGDAVATAADRVQTGLDAAATAGDAAATAADVVATAADRVQTGLDAAAAEAAEAAAAASAATVATKIFSSRTSAAAATIDPGVTAILVLGYASPDFASAATYKEVADTGTLEDWQFRSNGATRRWEHAGDNINVLQFGAKRDLSADAAPAFQAAIDFAAGRKVYAPVGRYKIGALISSTTPIHFVGDGNGAGPGPAAQANDNVTQLMLSYTNLSCFLVTSLYPSIFRDFQINVDPSYRGQPGIGIRLTAPGTSTAANSKIENVGFTNVYNPISMTRPNWHTVRGCYFDSWDTDAIYSETDTVGIEASTGYILNNFFFGGVPGCRSVIYLRNGYTVVQNNEILGGLSGILVDIVNQDAGYLRIFDNTIENQVNYGIHIKTTGDVPLKMVEISRTEFSQFTEAATFVSSIFIDDNGGTPWIGPVDISHIVTRHSCGATAKHIWIGAGDHVILSDIICEELGAASPVGIQVAGATSHAALTGPIEVKGTQFKGTFSSKFVFEAATILHDRQGIAFGAIPANCANGSDISVTDGKANNLAAQDFSLVGGGTGCFAGRVNGAWKVGGIA